MSFDVFFAVSPVTLIDSLADSPVLAKNDKNAEKLLSGHFSNRMRRIFYIV